MFCWLFVVTHIKSYTFEYKSRLVHTLCRKSMGTNIHSGHFGNQINSQKTAMSRRSWITLTYSAMQSDIKRSVRRAHVLLTMMHFLRLHIDEPPLCIM